MSKRWLMVKSMSSHTLLQRASSNSVQLTKELTCSPKKSKQSCMLRTEPETPLVEVLTSGEFRWRKHARLASASGKITIRLACWQRPTAKKKMALIMNVETRQRHAVRRRRVVLLAWWGLTGRRRSSLLFCAFAHFVKGAPHVCRNIYCPLCLDRYVLLCLMAAGSRSKLPAVRPEAPPAGCSRECASCTLRETTLCAPRESSVHHCVFC